MPLELASSADLEVYRSGDDEILLELAEAAVRAYCGWHIAPSREEDLTVMAPFGSVLMLPSLHVTDVTAVVVDGSPLTAESYDWNEAGWIYRIGGYWSPGSRRIAVVSVEHGFETTPPPVIQAIVDIVDRAKAPGKTAGLSHLRVGQVDRSWVTDGMTDANRDALTPYRIPGVA